MARKGVRFMRFWLILAVFLTFSASPAFAGVTVYELFTARECPACPAADQIFQQVVLSKPDVISLACHVTYFDSATRKDTMAAPFCDGRQLGYKDANILPKIFTPAVVVNGAHAVKGNDRNSVLTGLMAGGLETVQPVRLTRAGEYVNITLPPIAMNPETPADVWLFAYDNARAVTFLTKLMRWNGKPIAMAFPVSSVPASAGYAVIAQAPDQTGIIAAGKTAD